MLRDCHRLKKLRDQKDGAPMKKEPSCNSLQFIAGAIRARMKQLRAKFKTIDEAETAHGLTVEGYISQTNNLPAVITTVAPSLSIDQLKPLLEKLFTSLPTDRLVEALTRHLSKLDLTEATSVVDSSFTAVAEMEGLKDCARFPSLALTAMKKLQANGKDNIMTKFARCIAVERPESPGESLMPLGRMPFGLIEYQINFFNADHINQVREVPRDFQLWRETLDAELTNRQDKILTGPMWSGCSRDEVGQILKAKVNLACRSKKTVMNNLKAESRLSDKPEIQRTTLEQLKDINPNGRFWLKLDGADLRPVIQESMRGAWHGDADLLDGKLEILRAEYEDRKSNMTSLLNSLTLEALVPQLKILIDGFEEDRIWLNTGLEKAIKICTAKMKTSNTPEETLKSLHWEVYEFTKLLTQCQQFVSQYQEVQERITSASTTLPQVLATMKSHQESYINYIKNVFKKKRAPPASHVLVFMLADEKRSLKPYASPVQYIPYHSLRDQYLRDFTRRIKNAMDEYRLALVGTVTDGEFCSLRSQGDSRPLHVWQLVHDAKEAVSRMKKNTLTDMLIPTNVLTLAGVPIMRKENEVVTLQVKCRIFILMYFQGNNEEEAIATVRQEQVPDGYLPHPWSAGKNFGDRESHLENLRSVLATLYFRNSVDHWCQQGVDFRTYLYVPEEDPSTGIVHHDRADHNHLLKRIANTTRHGRYQDLNLDAIDKAILDPKTGLTEVALNGKRKQSVPDAEHLLSNRVATFLREQHEDHAATYIGTIANWHEATDGRGLTQLQRCKYNYSMLNYILDELMPWHRQCYDFKTLDINMPWDSVRGFTRETLVEVITNIESQEYRRRQNGILGYPEHPRASTTDDVENFFSICHRYLGNVFTLMDFQNRWGKIVNEFNKKIDPNLPFHYYTLNERYSTQQRPFDEHIEFNDEDEMDERHHPQRLHRLTGSRREDSSIFTAGRSLLPVQNRLSIRQRFFKCEVELPAIPQHEQLNLPVLP